jgi:hypothetical protein
LSVILNLSKKSDHIIFSAIYRITADSFLIQINCNVHYSLFEFLYLEFFPTFAPKF